MTLMRPKGIIPQELETFEYKNFTNTATWNY